jgi:hypothetical protein
MVSAEEWIDFRRTWRALLFFSRQVAYHPISGPCVDSLQLALLDARIHLGR